MKTTLDRFGRVIVPKGIRDRLGLAPGSELSIDEQEHALVLKPVEQEAPLRLEKGILVFTGTAKGELLEATRMHREERHRQIAGKKA